jgi:GTP-dependent phosphoenolpyruvate carboxykinase
MDLGESLNCTDKAEGTAEVKGFLKDAYVGKQMLVCFFCLGPTQSDFSISCAQITDSPYVAHSESILYRPGYEQFKVRRRRFFPLSALAGPDRRKRLQRRMWKNAACIST